MANPFRSDFTVYRRVPGTRTEGKWVEGSEAAFTVSASAQPLRGEEMQSLPEGRRTMQAIKIYSDTELNTEDEENGISPDVFEFRGDRYEIVTSEPHQSGVIDHFKHLATKEPAP